MRTLLRTYPFVAWPLAVALACACLFALVAWSLDRGAGFLQTENPIPGAPAGATFTTWAGSLWVPSSALYQFAIVGDRAASVGIDGVGVSACGPTGPERAAGAACPPRVVWLPAGFHLVDVTCEACGADPRIPVEWGEAGQPLGRLDSARVVAGRPRHPTLRAGAERVRVGLHVIAWTGAAAAVWFALVGLATVTGRRLAGARPPAARAGIRRRVTRALLAAIVVYAALLRIEALTVTYGAVERPGWARALQQRASALASGLRPSRITYHPAPLYPHKDSPPTRYFSDAQTYLQFARGMTSFYAAHYREPVFPFATKLWLQALSDQDAAVSFASASFSVLAVVAAYLLGSAAFSRWVGLAAALAMAIEEHLITEGITGGRDEAFMFAVAMFAWALVRWRQSPTPRRAVVFGAIGGFACLVRITSLSFVAPGLACVALLTGRPWKTRFRDAGLAAVAAAIVAGPYVANCYAAFGDPLYAINVHANVYRGAEGRGLKPEATAVGYIGDKFRTRPWQTLDTAVWGMTANPFLNKWSGFAAWSPTLGTFLSYAALFGIALFLGGWPGRVLLVVLAASLLPYAVTWKLGTDWRFTEHAYPFFLVASGVAIWRSAAWFTPDALAGLTDWRGIRPRSVAFWAAVALLAATGWWTIASLLPPRVVSESLTAGEDVAISMTGRDAAMIGGGWSEVLEEGSVTARVATGAAADILIPLPERRSYGVTVRLDPFPRPFGGTPPAFPAVEVWLNGSVLSRLDLRFSPDRVGAYDLILPADRVRTGLNRLRFVTVRSGPSSAAVPGVTGGSMLALWYVRVRSGPP